MIRFLPIAIMAVLFLLLILLRKFKKIQVTIAILILVINAAYIIYAYLYYEREIPVTEEWLYGKTLEEVELYYYCKPIHCDEVEQWNLNGTTEEYIFCTEYCYSKIDISFYYRYYVQLDKDGRICDIKVIDTGYGG